MGAQGNQQMPSPSMNNGAQSNTGPLANALHAQMQQSPMAIPGAGGVANNMTNPSSFMGIRSMPPSFNGGAPTTAPIQHQMPPTAISNPAQPQAPMGQPGMGLSQGGQNPLSRGFAR